MFQVVVTGDAFVEVVGHQTDKHTLRKPGNLARRNERVHLRVDGGGHVLPVDGDRLPLLQYTSKPLRKRLCRFSHHLSGKNVADGIHHHLRLLVTLVAYQLAEILKA